MTEQLPKRIMVIGGPGSGKSTLARMLGEQLALTVHHLDRMHFLPGWVEKDKAAFDAEIQDVVDGDAWVIDGNYARSWHHRLQRTDMVIWLDIPMPLRFRRALVRSWQYRGQARPDLADGCPETFNWETLEFLHYIVKTARGFPAKVDRWIRPSGVPVHRFTTNADADAWVRQLGTK